MLVKWDKWGEDPGCMGILSIIGGGADPTPTATGIDGIYQINHFNMNYCFSGAKIEEYPRNMGDGEEYLGCYGVADSPDQLFNLPRFVKHVRESERKFVVGMHRIVKSEQDPTGGWRWHKWGEYVGVQDPQMEYLYDEPVIEEVWTYHIYEILPEEEKK